MILEGYWNSDKHNTSSLYKKTCVECCENENLFSSFRSNPDYNYIVGCDSHGFPTAKMFFDYIKTNYKFLFEKLESFQEIDLIGGPPIYNFENGSLKLSSNTLRYIKVLGDLNLHIGDLSNMNIVEIGPGYGGQSIVINKFHKVNSYSYIDCIESINLIRKYISHFDFSKTEFYDTKSIQEKKWDLVIADSSLSEMDTEAFDFYLNTIVKNSKRAYMTMNDDYRRNETIEKIKTVFPNIKTFKDEPVLNPNNSCYILIE